jgi:hypothetical protein
MRMRYATTSAKNGDPPRTEPDGSGGRGFAILIVVAMTTVTSVAVNVASEVHYTWYSVVVVAAAVFLTAYLTQALARRRWRVLWVVVPVAIAVASFPAMNALTGPGCAEPCFTFENDESAGWGMRVEGDLLLGERLYISHTEDRGGLLDDGSLAFQFDLREPPRDKAQLKIEGLPLTRALSAWVLAEAGLPTTVEIRGYVLEYRADLANPWAYHHTNREPLTPGVWTHVEFPVEQFEVLTAATGRWVNPPLLIGFEIRDADGREAHGTVYFDHISVA